MKKTTITISDSATMDYSLWSQLPPEMVTHVLSLLPVKSLCRFKSVSPSWNTLISSPQFSKTHLHITNITNKPQKTILISFNHDALYSVDFADANPTARKLDYPLLEHSGESINFAGSCNGLILITVGNSNFLLNPLTRECRELPKSPLCDISSADGSQYFLRGLGYDSSTDNYKVVMIPYREYEFESEYNVDNIANVAVYSLETDAWSIIQVSHYYGYLQFLHGFYFNERLHWFCLHRPMIVAAFDLSGEIFREVQLPASIDNCGYGDIDYDYMAVLGGSLCLVVPYCNSRIEIWMMKKYGVRDSWTKFNIDNTRMSIGLRLSCLSAEDQVVLKIFGKIVNVNGEIVDESGGDKLVLYNLIKKTLRVMVVSGIPTDYLIMDNYIETLVSPNPGGWIRRHCEASLGES